MTMSWQVFAVVVPLAAIFAYLMGGLVRRARRGESDLAGWDEDWLENFSVESYRPMERLLQETDYEFLASQPGYHPGIARKLRAEHRRIFRVYLGSLIRDFNRLIHLAKLTMVYASGDRPDLARAIFRLRLNFYWNVIGTEVRLALAPLPLGSIDASRLVSSLAVARDSLERLPLLRHPA